MSRANISKTYAQKSHSEITPKHCCKYLTCNVFFVHSHKTVHHHSYIFILMSNHITSSLNGLKTKSGQRQAELCYKSYKEQSLPTSQGSLGCHVRIKLLLHDLLPHIGNEMDLLVMEELSGQLKQDRKLQLTSCGNHFVSTRVAQNIQQDSYSHTKNLNLIEC